MDDIRVMLDLKLPLRNEMLIANLYMQKAIFANGHRPYFARIKATHYVNFGVESNLVACILWVCGTNIALSEASNFGI